MRQEQKGNSAGVLAFFSRLMTQPGHPLSVKEAVSTAVVISGRFLKIKRGRPMRPELLFPSSPP